ncbi:HNH endonuclease [Halobellus ordinarius]|uniref:HNH endonuclease n=1 Tax=Halobellus ordinarius TaxID=3075120 RepID=UPI0028806F86|nr:HNH endonuclease [Halobellus sp. ZY16]
MEQPHSNDDHDPVEQSPPDAETDTDADANANTDDESASTTKTESDADADTQTTGATDREPERDAEADPDENAQESDASALPQETREEMLVDAGYRCQVCGRRGPEAGGLATLQVHHIDRERTDVDEHDPANLTVLCRACHIWHHQQATREDAPVELSEADVSALLPQDIDILRVLAEDGPARTGDVAAAVTGELTVSSVRERLWVLMGLDDRVDERDTQLVDKDVETNEWGLVGQIETSARGHIPEDPQELLQRMEDEQVRQALDRGCDRRTVAEVLGITRRTTFNKEKRARAYGFPADAYSNRGGRPTSTGTSEDAGPDTTTETDRASAGEPTGDVDGDDDGAGESIPGRDTQQRLDAVGEDESDAAPTKAAPADGAGDNASEPDADVGEAVRAAIDALETVADAVESSGSPSS